MHVIELKQFLDKRRKRGRHAADIAITDSDVIVRHCAVCASPKLPQPASVFCLVR